MMKRNEYGIGGSNEKEKKETIIVRWSKECHFGRGITEDGRIHLPAVEYSIVAEKKGEVKDSFCKFVRSREDVNELIMNLDKRNSKRRRVMECWEELGPLDEVRKLKFNKNTLYLITGGIVSIGEQYITKAKVKGEGIACFEELGSELFMRIFGSHYISGGIIGAGHLGCMKIVTNSPGEVNRVESAGSALLTLDKLATDFQSVLKERKINYTAQCSYYTWGAQLDHAHHAQDLIIDDDDDGIEEEENAGDPNSPDEGNTEGNTLEEETKEPAIDIPLPPKTSRLPPTLSDLLELTEIFLSLGSTRITSCMLAICTPWNSLPQIATCTSRHIAIQAVHKLHDLLKYQLYHKAANIIIESDKVNSEGIDELLVQYGEHPALIQVARELLILKQGHLVTKYYPEELGSLLLKEIPISQTAPFYFTSRMPQIHLLISPIQDQLKGYIYNISTGKINSILINKLPKTAIPYDRFASIQISKCIFICGGRARRSFVDLESCWEVEIEHKFELIQRSCMKSVKRYTALVEIYEASKRIVYSIGGCKGEPGCPLTFLNICEKYDWDGDLWRCAPSLNEPKAGCSGCVFQNSYIYIFGGLIQVTPNSHKKLVERTSSQIEKLTLGDDEGGWAIVNLSVNAGWGSGGCAPGCIQITRYSILVFGRELEGGKLTTSSLIYNPMEQSMRESKCALVAADSFFQRQPVLWEGNVYIFGAAGDRAPVHQYSVASTLWTLHKYIY